MRYFIRTHSDGTPAVVLIEDDDGTVRAYGEPGYWQSYADVFSQDPENFRGDFLLFCGPSTFGGPWYPPAKLDDAARAKIDQILKGWTTLRAPERSGGADVHTIEGDLDRATPEAPPTSG